MGNKTKPVDGAKATVAGKIDKYLKENNITNKEFGALFGVSESNVRHWRTGETSLDINQLVRLAEIWKTTPNEILDFKK